MSIVANLLVKGEYDVVEALTSGRNMTAKRLQHLIEADGRGFIFAPVSAYEELYGEQIGEEPATFHVWFPLWTAEGPSDLVLELNVTEDIPDTVGTEIADLRVRSGDDDLRGLTVLARPDLRGQSDRPDDLPRPDRARGPRYDDTGRDRLLTDEEREAVVRVVRALVDRDHDQLSRDRSLRSAWSRSLPLDTGLRPMGSGRPRRSAGKPGYVGTRCHPRIGSGMDIG